MEPIRFDIGSMTLDEAITFEEMAGYSVDEFNKPGRPRTVALKALVYIAARRDDPTVTPDTIGALGVAELGNLIVADDPISPSGDD